MDEKIISLNEDGKTTITDEQVHEIYETLATEDSASTEALNNASTETEENYESFFTEKINQTNDSIITGLKVTDSDYKEVFKEYHINNEETTDMLKLIEQYRNNENINYYEKLPKTFKNIADGIKSMVIKHGSIINKNESAKMLLNELIHDSQFVNAMNEFESEVNVINNEINSEYSKLYMEALDEAFDKIDKIEIEDPEKAKRIKAVKAAFDDSITFSKQMEFAKNIGVNKLNKLTKRFDGETIYFNKKVNVTDVKIPDIRELVGIIHNELPQYEIEDIKKFIVVICRSTFDMDLENNIADLAYVYKMINNIYRYKFADISTSNNETATLLFGNIAEVINCIKNK